MSSLGDEMLPAIEKFATNYRHTIELFSAIGTCNAVVVSLMLALFASRDGRTRLMARANMTFVTDLTDGAAVDLDPIPGAARAIHGPEPLRRDALAAEFAGLLIHDLAVSDICSVAKSKRAIAASGMAAEPSAPFSASVRVRLRCYVRLRRLGRGVGPAA